MKNRSTYLFLLLLLISSNISYSQPGWQDRTERYFYSITDESGKEISFKKNKAYSIMIDDRLYRSPNIPQHKLKIATETNFNYKKGYEIQIRVNDFSLVIFSNDYYSNGKNKGKDIEIRIIHKTDTLFISQSSGTGSGEMERIEVNGVYKNQKRPADFTLQFIPGHYFFPDWAKQQIENIPETSGSVKIKNPQNFMVSEISNPNVFQKTKKYREERYKTEVIENFMSGYFSLVHTAEPTQVENENPLLMYSAIKELMLPVQGNNEYAGLIEYHYKTPDIETNVTRFATINIEENTIKLWSPIEKIPYFSTFKIYNDVFNKIVYSRSFIRDTTCHESQLKNTIDCPYKTIFYRSSDSGKTWQEDNEMNNLFDNYEIRELEFLDAEYALVYRRRDDRARRITQGIYYLLKNLQIVDSLKSPEFHYSNNYNNYRYALKRDTVFLGSWNDEPNNYSDYFQPYLTKVDGNWKFQIEQRTAEQDRYTIFHPKSSLDSVKDYQNFTLVNKNKLVFKSGAGTLTLKEDVVDDRFHFGSYHILENGNHIYLINCHGHTYFSQDGGTSWFLYPSSLKAESSSYDNYRSYRFLNIDEQGIISYLDYEWNQERTRKVMKKMYYQFLIE